ncbi:hypothetical protein [Saccharibacillus deserti]|uniref:hypothetical protein n=1 Tax=Saccharibacillus deserti TaxID=1634444 RepID=UPI0015551077|nr:hypothetical protein [Saccharibacillus deserti]
MSNEDLETAVVILLGEINKVREYTNDKGSSRLLDEDDLLEAVKNVEGKLSKIKQLALSASDNAIVKEAKKMNLVKKINFGLISIATYV